MSKFNRGAQPLPRVARASSPLSTVVNPQLSSTLIVPDTTTHEGGDGFRRDSRTALFLACTSSFITENSFYETGDERTNRVVELTHAVVLEEGGLEWLLNFVTWLRGPEGNIRTAAIVVAAEAVRGVHLAFQSGARQVDAFTGQGTGRRGAASGEKMELRRLVAAALQRADEPGEMIAYWTSRYGRPIPNSIRRGIGDAVTRLYTEYSTLKYDTAKASIRFGDVLALCRPQPPADKAVLFRHLIERRHPNWKDGGGQELGQRGIPDSLEMLNHRRAMETLPVEQRREWMRKHPAALQDMLKLSGATWEYLSGWLSDGKGMDREAWEAVIPQMGYMALLRNLRNFDEAGVSNEVAARIAVMLEDREQVAKSRQFPFRFLSAYEAAPSDRWKLTLGTALGYATQNLPELNGSTLIMVDTSASMNARLSSNSARTYVEVAALFGIALTYRNVGRVGLYMFADRAAKHSVTVGGSVLNEMARFKRRIGEVGHGTQIEVSTMQAFGTGYDRVIIISDMQSFGDRAYYSGNLSSRIPAHVPIYAFDLSSYEAGVIPTGGAARFQLGGLSDATFRMIPQVEAGLTGNWPWEK
jgi:hypothetical protein